MNIQQAIEMMQSGHKMCHRDWPGSIYITFEEDAANPPRGAFHMHKDGRREPWTPSHSDLSDPQWYCPDGHVPETNEVKPNAKKTKKNARKAG